MGSLPNKTDKLMESICNAENKPDVVCITEVNPKTSRYQLELAEINLEGYVLVTSNSQGKGVKDIATHCETDVKAEETNIKQTSMKLCGLKLKRPPKRSSSLDVYI